MKKLNPRDKIIYLISAMIGYYFSFSIAVLGEMPKRIGDGMHTFVGEERFFAIFPFLLGLYFTITLVKSILRK